MTIEEAVEWIREWIRYIDQKPITTSSLLARKLYDIMIEDQRCPRCGVKFEHLSYVERLQTNYFYRCPECGEMY